MFSNTNRRQFLAQSTVTVAASSSLIACGDGSATPAQFVYGVASGDPLNDRVILWTHAKIPNSNQSVGLTWQVANDIGFTNLVAFGKVDALEENGFTAKVDATGLTAGSSYFYRFTDGTGASSAVGITRTLPAATAASVKFAVFSCSLYSEGYFNAYAEAAKSDTLYAVHLGDYIYEYGSDPAKYGNKDAVALGRVTSPANDIVSLSDYRTRYALYRSDASLQALHAKMPWIAVWDDHEFANNAYVGGAQNHSTVTQGDWVTRKNIAARVYHEWLPIRAPDKANLLKIYRRFDFGNLLTLHMVDTRIEGRDRQYDDYGDADGGTARYIAAITPNVAGVMPDASHRMMSTEQQTWLTTGMSASAATWQFMGNQDIMAKLWIPASVLQAQGTAAANPTTANQTAVTNAVSAYLGAKSTRAFAPASLTAVQNALLNPTTNPPLPFNLDSWDGYPANRDAILKAVKTAGKRLVVLSGDSHNGWFANLTTLAGDKVGVEFAGSSVTSTGFESAGLGGFAPFLDGTALVPTVGQSAVGAGLGLINDLNYVDTTRRGYLVMTVTAASVKGEYVYVDTVKSKTFAATVGRTITVTATGAITYA